MNKIFCCVTLIFLGCSLTTHAQKLMKIVYVSKGAITTNTKEAEWLIAIRNVNGRYQRNDYTMNGPLKRVKTFKDLNQTILDGPYLEYDNKGCLQLAGFYTDNKKSGKWFHYNDSGNIVKREEFEGKGLFDETSIAVSANDSITAPVFKGGKKEWRNYLNETLNWDNNTDKLKDEVIKLSFTINESGVLNNIILLKSEYFYIDNEVIKTISSSPKWKPGSINGKPVARRYAQSISLYDLFH